jgi:hypothetical protein
MGDASSLLVDEQAHAGRQRGQLLGLVQFVLGRADSRRARAVDWLVVKFDNAGLVDESYIYMD